MNLVQLATQIAQKIGMPDAATLAKVQQWIASRYRTLYQQALWRDACTVYTVAVTGGTRFVVLPAQAEAVQLAAWDRQGLFPADEALQLNQRIEQLLDSGTPCEVAELGRVGVKGDPAGQSLILTSDDASEASQFTILGERDGVEARVTTTATGTTPLVLSQAFDLILAWSRTVGTGTLILSRADAVELGRLGPTETERYHVRVRLMPAAEQAGTLLLAAKRRCHPLEAPSDVLVVRSLVPAVEAFAHGDALEWQRQYGKAQRKFEEALGLLTAAANQDVWQPLRLPRVIASDGVGNPRPW